MKHFTLLALAIVAMAACNRPPKPYREAMEMIGSGKYEYGIEMLKRVTIEDKSWLDSAALRKNDAFEQLVGVGDWERTLILVDRESDDKAFKREMKRIVIDYAKQQIANGQIDSLMRVLPANEKEMIACFDSTVVQKIADMIAAKVFLGTWSTDKRSIKGCEIYFERDGDIYLGKSNKSISGWTKDKTIYKISTYKGNLVWKCQPRIFSYNYYYDKSSEYFGSKGTVRLFSADSMLIDYVSINSPLTTFARMVEMPDSLKAGK